MGSYRTRLAAPLSVVLALALALSPSLSWYACADEPFQGQETENERPEERGAVGSGDEPREVAEEPENGGEAGEGAAEGEAAPPSLPEVPSGAGPGSGGASGSGLDGSPEDAYSSGGRDSESSVSDELGSFDAVHGEQLDGSSAAGDSGSSDFDTRGVAEEGLENDSLSPFAISGGNIIDTLISPGQNVGGTGFNLRGYKWNANIGTILWIVSILAHFTSDILSQLVFANNYLKAIDTHSKNSDSYLSSSLSLLKKQWGYGYGGTVILESNSPAGWLSGLFSNSSYTGTLSDGNNGTWSAAQFLAYLFNKETEYQKWYRSAFGYGYGGTVVVNSNSPAGWIKGLYERSEYKGTLGDGNKGEFYSAQLLAYIFGQSYGIRSNTQGLSGWLNYTGKLADGGSGTFSGAQLLAYVFGQLLSISSDTGALSSLLSYSGVLGDGNRGEFSSAQLLAYIFGQSYGIRSNTQGLSGWLNYTGKLADGGSGTFSGAQLLAYVFGQLYGFRQDFVSHSTLVSQGFADVLQKMDGLTVEADVSIDLSGIESRLDAIRNLLVAAGLIENGKDLLDVIFGDLSGIGQAAATGAIQSAMESAFPFCIPALVKQLFGLLAYEGSAPVWEFDICGNPLVCDFSGFQLVADCTSFLSRLGLVLALLVNTRKFVFAFNGGGAS